MTKHCWATRAPNSVKENFAPLLIGTIWFHVARALGSVFSRGRLDFRAVRVGNVRAEIRGGAGRQTRTPIQRELMAR
jgi:hypothetical protein